MENWDQDLQVNGAQAAGRLVSAWIGGVHVLVYRFFFEDEEVDDEGYVDGGEAEEEEEREEDNEDDEGFVATPSSV